MTITTIPTVAAARPRTLSMPGTALPVGTALVPTAWRSAAPAVAVPTYLRTKSAFLSTSAYYNAIRTTVAAATVPAARDHVGVDKQAAPPRGVPR